MKFIECIVCHCVTFSSLSPLSKHRKLLLKEKCLEERPQTGQREQATANKTSSFRERETSGFNDIS